MNKNTFYNLMANAVGEKSITALLDIMWEAKESGAKAVNVTFLESQERLTWYPDKPITRQWLNTFINAVSDNYIVEAAL